MFPAWRLSSSPPWKIRNIIGLHSPPWLWGFKISILPRGVDLSRLNLDGSEKSPIFTFTHPTGMVQWSNDWSTWLCKFSHTSHGVLKFAVPNPRSAFSREGLNSQKIPPNWKTRVKSSPWNGEDPGSVRFPGVRLLAPGWWKNIVSFIKPLGLQKMSGVKNICGYLNSHFDGYTQVITWNLGSMWNFRGWKG